MNRPKKWVIEYTFRNESDFKKGVEEILKNRRDNDEFRFILLCKEAEKEYENHNSTFQCKPALHD